MLTCSNCDHDCFLEFAVGDMDVDPPESVLICTGCGMVLLTNELTWEDLSIDDLKRLVMACENFTEFRPAPTLKRSK